jgi:hypothetical protein
MLYEPNTIYTSKKAINSFDLIDMVFIEGGKLKNKNNVL